MPPLEIRATHTSSTLLVLGGSVGLASDPAHESTLAKLTLRGGSVVAGPGGRVIELDWTGGQFTGESCTVVGRVRTPS